MRPSTTRKPLALLIAALFAGQALALPSNPTFVAGSGTMAGNTVSLSSANSQGNALITWGGGFNIGAGEVLNFRDATGSAGIKNIVNMNAATGPATLSGGLYADNNLRILVVSPAGVNIDSTATIRAANFSALSGAASIDPSGQVVISGNSAPLNYSPGAAILVTGQDAFKIGPSQAITYRASAGNDALPWLDGQSHLYVDTGYVAPGQTANMVGTIQSGVYDLGGSDITLTGSAASGAASITNANNVIIEKVSLGQGTKYTATEWVQNPDGTLSLVQPGQAGTVSGFNLSVGTAAAPVSSLTVRDAQLLGTSRLDAHATATTVDGSNRLTGIINTGTLDLSGVLDGQRGPATDDLPYTPGGGTATFVVTNPLNVANAVDLSGGLVVKDDHVLDLQLKNAAPLAISNADLDLQNGTAYVRTLGTNVTLDGWTLKGAPTTATDGNNLLEITAGKGTIDGTTGKALGAPGWLDLSINNLKADNVNIRIDNGNGLLTDSGLRDVTISNSTINQGTNAWSGFFLETARKATLVDTQIDVPLGASADSRVYVTTQGYNGAAGEIVINNSTLRGANVLVGGGYGQLENTTLADVKAVNPSYVPGSDPTGGQWASSQDFYNQLLGGYKDQAATLSYDPSTGKLDAKRNTGTVTLTNSTLSGLATSKVSAKTRVALDATSSVIAELVGDDGLTLIAGDSVNYAKTARAEASLSNLYSAKTATGLDTVSANPKLSQADGSATTQAYIAAPTVDHAGLIKAGTGPDQAKDVDPCVANPASCYQPPSLGKNSSNPTSPTPDLTNHIITSPTTGTNVTPGEVAVSTPIVITPVTPSAPATPPQVVDGAGNVLVVTPAPGGGWMPAPGTYTGSTGSTITVSPGGAISVTPAPGSTVTIGNNTWQVGPGGASLQPINGETYEFGNGTPALTWNNGAWVAQPTNGSSLTAPDGTQYTWNNGGWTAVLPPGTTKVQDGTTYIVNSDGTWSKLPVNGDTAKDANGIDYTWNNGVWTATPSNGTTLTQDGITYTWNNGAWTPNTGSQLSTGGKNYAFENGQWVWQPAAGNTAQNSAGTTYVYDPATGWTPQYTVGQTTTQDGSVYQFDGTNWVWQPQPGDTAVNPANGLTYAYDGSLWQVQPVNGDTINDPLNNTWTYTGGGWVPNNGSTVTNNGKDYVFDGTHWVWAPSTGATVTDGMGLTQTWDGAKWVSTPANGSTLTDGNGNTWAYNNGSWTLTPGSTTTDHGVGYTWTGTTWTPNAGSTITSGGKTYTWDGSAWTWTPTAGSTVSGSNGVTYTYQPDAGWTATPAPGTTITSGGTSYTWNGNAWTPSAGATTTTNGKNYTWDGSQWVWQPVVGDTVTDTNGLTQTWNGSAWAVTPGNGSTLKDGSNNTWAYNNGVWTLTPGSTTTQNGVAYSWNGTTWAPSTGTTLTQDGTRYTWDGAQWHWQPVAGDTITDENGVAYTYQPSTGWVAAPTTGDTITSGGTSYTWNGNTWAPSQGATTTRNGQDYKWDGSQWVWQPVVGDTVTDTNGLTQTWNGSAWAVTPSNGSTLKDGRDNTWAYNNGVWTLTPGSTTTQNGVAYSWNGTTWAPSTGTTLTQDGASYTWDGSQWNWQPVAGDTLTGGNGVTYTYQPATGWMATPTTGTTVNSGGTRYTWSGTTWMPSTGATVSTGDKTYAWDGSQWIWQPAPGSTATGNNGIRYTWNNGGWQAAPTTGTTLKDPAGNTWTWTGGTWAPATGTQTTNNGITYAWTPGGWVPLAGSTTTRNGTTYTYDPSTGWKPTTGGVIVSPPSTTPKPAPTVQVPGTQTVIPVPSQPPVTRVDTPTAGQAQVKQPIQTYSRTIVLPVETGTTGGLGNWKLYLGAEKIAR